MIINKCMCSSVLLYFFQYEVRQATKQEGYIKELWNLFDFSLIASYAVLNIVEFASGDKSAIIIMDIIVVLLTFLKLNFFLRIYDGFSFLVSMMSSVFRDIQYFILFFLIFIFQFGIIFVILFSAERIEEYDGIGIVGYFLMIFRISSGDFAVENYKDQESTFMISLSWTIWLIAVLILNIVFMNFIIAVISESYEKVMQKLVAQSYKVKANMIVERELLLTPQNEEERRFYFPENEVIQNVIPLQNKIELLDRNSSTQQDSLRQDVDKLNVKMEEIKTIIQTPSSDKDEIKNLNQKVESLSVKLQGCETALEQLNANIMKLLEK
ncbi:wd-40 repeat protein [Stylonychia lemnae]|uniref:Wd-40 repeat protein n=1 Tax=Stylonychia lemnae TaxID=5949 RepID=A0A078AH83_STYLE|nr:wd-40 repeat protein [Stylonychia lemnae]|eukprot:CDW81604.1 wd-40 repeat protein [Stylonychia lemnae]